MGRSKLEEDLAFHLYAAAHDENAPWPWPAPVREHHPFWCCDHNLNRHKDFQPERMFCKTCGDWCPRQASHARKAHRIDFAWPTLKVAVECEGGIHTGGRHVRGAGFESDLWKYGELTRQGWTVIRLSQRMITSGEALRIITAALGRAAEAPA